MTTTTLTSELEAINTILEACDEAPVTSLALSGLYPLDKAKRALTEASRAVQTSGWQFNTEAGYLVTLAGDLSATLPDNTLDFAPDKAAAPTMSLVLRGTRLYDRKAHSYILKSAPTGTLVVLLGWDELPQPARQYITIRAASTMQGRSSVSDSTYRYTQEDEQDARLALEDSEAGTGSFNMLTDSRSVGSVLLNHDYTY